LANNKQHTTAMIGHYITHTGLINVNMYTVFGDCWDVRWSIYLFDVGKCLKQRKFVYIA